jgi:hypothetical protein
MSKPLMLYALVVLSALAGLVYATKDPGTTARVAASLRRLAGQPRTWTHPGPFPEPGKWQDKEWACEVREANGPLTCVER